MIHVVAVDHASGVDGFRNLVDVSANLMHLARKLMKLRQVNMNHATVNQHLPGVEAEIVRMALRHSFLN